MTIVDDDDEITTNMRRCGRALQDTQCTLDIIAVQVIFVDTIIGDDEKFQIEVKFRHVDGAGDSSVERTDFTVYTNEAWADADTRDRVKDNMWACESNVIVQFVDPFISLDFRASERFCKTMTKMQDFMGEEAQDIVLALVGDKQLEEAIDLIIGLKPTGRGHFLATYDGQEFLFYRNKSNT